MPSRTQVRTTHRGTITGYVLKLARESIPSSQEHLAHELGVDRATVQSWESGRRPFTSVALGHAAAVRTKMARLGADLYLLALLDDAVESDHLLGVILDADPAAIEVNQHALGWTVLRHTVTELLAWAVVDQQPAFLRRDGSPTLRRGPVPPAPPLAAAEREAFFTNLQIIADRTGQYDDEHVLLRRQACFLAGMDPTGQSTDWLRRSASRRTVHTWSALWPDTRSVATSLAKQGDPEMLRDFVAQAHSDDTCELAGLNYWAYWVGEVGQRQRDDTFMIDKSLAWRGGCLLRHLVARLHANHPFIDLNIHSLWSLLATRRGLALDDPDTGRGLILAAHRVLDHAEISVQARRELTSVLYGLRLTGLTSQGLTQ